MTVSVATVAADVEAEVRRLMARRAAMPLTYLTRGPRAELMVEIGLLIDEWLALR